MKNAFKLIIICISILSIFGCNTKNKYVDVIVDGNGQFPKQLAGTWKSDNDMWEIALEPDGTISWAIISLGYVKIIPGKTTIVPMAMGGEGIFKPGLWTVRYLQNQHDLIIEIIIEDFRTELGTDILYGKTHDVFSGTVSNDGDFWWTDRYSYSEYFADTQNYHNYKLPVDPNENPKETLLFKKISE